MYHVNVDKPTQAVTIHKDGLCDSHMGDRQKMVRDGFWKNYPTLAAVEAFARMFDLPGWTVGKCDRLSNELGYD